jgi:transposase
LEVLAPEFTKGGADFTLADRIAVVLHGRHMTAKEIADETGLKETVVRATLNRYREDRFNSLPGSHRWELLPAVPARTA